MKKKIIITLITMLTYFTINSSYAQTGTKIKPDDLPAAVTEELQKNYKKYAIINAKTTEDPEQGTLYKINVKKKSKEFNLLYNAEGKLIRASRVYTYEDTQLRKKAPAVQHDGHDHQH